MKYTPAIKERIITALTGKLPNQRLGPCALCGTAAWFPSDGFVLISVTMDAPNLVFGGPALPSIALICSNCGNTHLLNLKVLGLEELLKPEPQAQPMPEQPK
ncbi:MAG TPA: hypothetical protein DC047_15405 [Blastocatellia bacterium]|nr:hypothetical protein [Blastocatellia bacterium]